MMMYFFSVLIVSVKSLVAFVVGCIWFIYPTECQVLMWCKDGWILHIWAAHPLQSINNTDMCYVWLWYFFLPYTLSLIFWLELMFVLQCIWNIDKIMSNLSTYSQMYGVLLPKGFNLMPLFHGWFLFAPNYCVIYIITILHYQLLKLLLVARNRKCTFWKKLVHNHL